MFRKQCINVARLACIWVAAVAVVLTPNITQAACSLASFALDPSSTGVYYSFSTSTPFVAYKLIVHDPITGVIVGSHTGTIPGISASGTITGLLPCKQYRFVLKIKCSSGTLFKKVKDVMFNTTC